ncbi:MAG: site-specific integrase [Bacteroidales bacterium]|jgi:integrase|nr:site-specific integrase [Bacteroidales bacterium]
MTTKFELRADKGTRKRKDGLSKVRIKICSGKTNIKYIPLKVYGDPKYWDNDMEIFVVEKGVKKAENKERNKRHEENNAVLADAKARCKDILDDFRKTKQNPTVTQFVERFVEMKHTEKIGDYFKNHIKNLKETNHIGNANSYDRAYKILKLFYPNFDKLFFVEVNLSFVQKFERWLQIRGCNGNTRKHYHARLRAILNNAIKEKIITEQTYPYGKYGFAVNRLEQKTAKRYLPKDVIKTIRTTEIEDYTLELTRRVFVAQFLCFGISFVDAAALKRTDIVNLESGRHIVYKRQKTENAKSSTSIHIKITDELQEHLTWFENNYLLIDDYLFPIVSRQGYENEKLYNHIKNRLNRNNKNLKNLATHFEIENISLTSYVTRHSMAMALKKNANIRLDQISQAMGHVDLNTTQTYLGELTAEEMSGVAEALVNF